LIRAFPIRVAVSRVAENGVLRIFRTYNSCGFKGNLLLGKAEDC
jgi:hypothetical protein